MNLKLSQSILVGESVLYPNCRASARRDLMHRENAMPARQLQHLHQNEGDRDHTAPRREERLPISCRTTATVGVGA